MYNVIGLFLRDSIGGKIIVIKFSPIYGAETVVEHIVRNLTEGISHNYCSRKPFSRFVRNGCGVGIIVGKIESVIGIIHLFKCICWHFELIKGRQLLHFGGMSDTAAVVVFEADIVREIEESVACAKLLSIKIHFRKSSGLGGGILLCDIG